MVQRSRADRKSEIVNALSGVGGCVSTHRLAYLVHMAPSPHFRKLVYEMYREGLIQGTAEKKPNGRTVYFWSLNELPQQQLLMGM